MNLTHLSDDDGVTVRMACADARAVMEAAINMIGKLGYQLGGHGIEVRAREQFAAAMRDAFGDTFGPVETELGRINPSARDIQFAEEAIMAQVAA